MTGQEDVKELIESTMPGTADRLLMRLLIEAGGDIKTAFGLLVAECPPSVSQWGILLWTVMDQIGPDDLTRLADKPARLPSEVLSNRIEEPTTKSRLPI